MIRRNRFFVTTELENKKSLENIQFVYGAGVIEKFSSTGYEVIKNDTLLKDIIEINETKYDYDKILSKTLLSANKYHLPVHYFIYKSNLDEKDINKKIMDRRITRHNQICNGRLDITSINERYNSIDDLLRNYPDKSKLIEKTVYLYPNKINKA